MLDWKCLEADPAHIDGFAFRHNLALADRIRREQLPRLGCRIDGTGRPICEAPGVIRVTVRHDDRGRP